LQNLGTCKYDEEYLDQFYDSQNQIEIPTLHIFGKADTQISCQSSFELTEYFSNPKIWFHEYGHTIPHDCLPSVREFLEEISL
jgi:pimeloyl-ACP methyl ester carboxylesterase